MKQICSICLILNFTLSAQFIWGQTPDSLPRAKDSTSHRSVVTDRLNEPDERERGPSLSKILKRADDSYGKKHYYAAMKYYGFVLQSEPLHVEALKGFGESAFAIASLDSAEAAFQRMVDRGINPADYYPKMRLADVKFRKGLYVEAADLYHDIAHVAQMVPVPESLKTAARAQEALCIWAQKDGLDNPYVIQTGSFALLDTAKVSMPEFAEYVAYPHNDELYFSAYRFDLRKDRQKPKRNAIKIMKATGAEGSLGPTVPMPISEAVFNDEKLQHTAHLSFNLAGNVAYYAAGNYQHDSADIRFDLYRRRMVTDSTWSQPEKLNTVNKPGYTSTQPAIGKLPGDPFETLFFVSDRPLGAGRHDKNIWYSRIIGDSLTPPSPLTDLNTEGNDVTPFYHTPSHTLFFSTDGLKTIGGLDVYKSKLEKDGHWKPADHLGDTINSSANDAFFVLDNASHRAFFSSNRNGNVNYSEEGCCYDIYSVDFLVKYKALALHDIKRDILPYTQITMYEVGNNQKLVTYARPVPDMSSTYTFNVKLGKKYVLIAEKAGFSSDTLEIETPEELWITEIVDTLYLRPKLALVATVWDCETGEPIYGASANLVNHQKGGVIQSEVLPSDSNRKEYKIDFEGQYQVVVEKEGYEGPDTSVLVSTMGLSDGDTFFVELRLRRPDPFKNFVPIALYFDNDFPKRIRATDPILQNTTDPYLVEMKNALLKDPRDPKYQDTVMVNYQATFVDYARRYDTLFIPKYIKDLRGEHRIKDSVELRTFFEDTVRYNESRFREFAEKLDSILQQGDSITIEIQGYASPLANPEYNLHLTNRRTACVYNMFVNFDGGVFLYRPFPGRPGQFLGYYKPDNTGQLKFSRKPNGEAASKYKGKEAEDTRNPLTSIYDVRASRERRVEITGVKIQKSRCKVKEK